MSDTVAKAIISHDPEAGTFTLSKGEWSNTYGIETLSYWLGWYKHQREKFPKAGNNYDDNIAALESLAQKLLKS